MSASWRFRQLVPATGWYVVYKNEDAEGARFACPLACWALGEFREHPFAADNDWEEGGVCGIDMSGEGADGLSPCEEVSNFSHYVHESQLGSIHVPLPLLPPGAEG